MAPALASTTIAIWATARPVGLMNKYIMIGPQGSGKGTQAQLLSKRYGFVHISIGQIFRWHVANHTKLGSRVMRITEQGNLVSDEIVEEVVRDRLEMHDWRYGFVLDGFPRTAAQAAYLFENWNLDRAIYLDLDDSLVSDRVMKRARQGEGSGFTKRADDNPAALRRRLSQYHMKTQPLLSEFAERGMLLRVDASLSIEEVFRKIAKGLHLAGGNENSAVLPA